MDTPTVEATPEVVVETPNADPVLEPQVPPEEAPTPLPSEVGEFTMPEKFAGKSVEDIAKAYVELEKFKNGGETPTPTPAPETPTPTEEPNKYYQEFVEKGELSEESFVELEAAGHTREDINDRLGYEKYKQTQKVNQVVDVIGGIENYQAMEAWATDNVVDAERTEFTTEFTNASDYVKKVMLKDMYARFQAGTATPKTPDVIHTNESQYTISKGYESQHALQADMADPRYGTDRSYTQAVEAKVAKSPNF